MMIHRRIASVASVLLLCIASLSAQWATCYQSLSSSKVLDTASYEVLYQVQMRWGRRIVTDTISLLIGRQYTQTYNPRLKRMKRQKDSLFRAGHDVAPSVNFLTFPEDTYCSLKTGQITAVYRSFEPGPPLRYEEPAPKFGWVTSATDSTVLTYPCTAAQMSFRRRDYRALFTMSIPLSVGPWKFGGLPGLILKIEDAKQDYIFTAIAIRSVNEGIHLWDWKYQENSRKDIRKYVERMHKKPKTYMRIVTNGMVMFRDGDADTVSFPYNPIELE